MDFYDKLLSGAYAKKPPSDTFRPRTILMLSHDDLIKELVARIRDCAWKRCWVVAEPIKRWCAQNALSPGKGEGFYPDYAEHLCDLSLELMGIFSQVMIRSNDDELKEKSMGYLIYSTYRKLDGQSADHAAKITFYRSAIGDYGPTGRMRAMLAMILFYQKKLLIFD